MKTLIKIFLLVVGGLLLLKLLGGLLFILLKIPIMIIGVFAKAFAGFFSLLPFLLVCLVLLFFIKWIISLFSGNCRGREPFEDEENVRLSKVKKGLDRMEKRLKNLETIFNLRR